MDPQDLLSAALDMSGNSDIAGPSNAQPSTSFGQTAQKVQSTDIKPFVLNGQYYYGTPRGVVQFRGNRIVLVPQFEIEQAIQAEKARRLISMNGLFGLPDLSKLMNNGMPYALYNGHLPQIAQLQNPALMADPRRTTSQILINSQQEHWGSLTHITPQRAEMPTMNAQLQNQLNFDQSTRKVGRNDFALIYDEVFKEKQVDDEDEEQFQAETYADYMPTKLKIGVKHPDIVVETASLSSVQPPDIWYKPVIPEEVYDEGKLSALQMEAIVYACQQHEEYLPNGHRAGFLIGDGAGVGKGRTVAGLIYENYLQGRKKSIWLSVSADLKLDAERDLKDIGASQIKVHALNKLKYAKISSTENGKIKKGVIFSTYSSLISESTSAKGACKSRIGQLVQWCGEDFDGVIIFDECHKAKNLIPEKGKGGTDKSTKTGLRVKELQDSLPKARIVYASATGASEPRNMAYMVRLGLWGEGTPFKEFSDFSSTVDRRGVGAMELVAIDMKLNGRYIARQLSFKGVDFEIDEVPLSEEFTQLYDECVELWEDARTKFETALNLMEEDAKKKKHYWGQFWSSHQRFFKYLCIANKVDRVVEVAKEELRNGNAVVIGLQSTGEARTLEAIEEQGELNDFISTAGAQFQSMIEKHFPAPNRKKTRALLGLPEEDLKDYSDRKSRSARQETQRRIKSQSMSGFIVSDDSETDSDRTEVSQDGLSESSPSDDNFEMSDSEVEAKRSRKRKKNSKIIEDDEEDDESQSGSDSDDYSSLDSESPSPDSDSDDSDEEDEDPCELYSGKRSRNKKVGRNKKKKPAFGSEDAGDLCEKLRDSLLAKFEKLSPTLERICPNTIDQLIDKLGGPDEVAEMTGRKGRVVQRDGGDIVYESRREETSLEMMNICEKNKFMSGQKIVALISDAASSGISLQADRRALNRKRRVHITIENPFSADRAIQQFGRTHRSNQVTAPKYIFTISKLAGEKRFSSILAKRLQSLGALTHGDRRATETVNLSQFAIDEKYSKPALETVMNVMMNMESSPVPAPGGYKNNEEQFFKDVRSSMVGVGLLNYDKHMDSYAMDKDTIQIAKFLNRLLGMRVRVQNALFDYFALTMEAYVRHAKRLGKYDQGIMDLNEDFGKMQILKHDHFELHQPNELHPAANENVKKVELRKVAVERGIDWETSLRIYGESNDDEEGYYKSRWDTAQNVGVLLAIKDKSSTKNYGVKSIFQIYKPNTGSLNRAETLSSLKERYRKVSHTDSKTKAYWNNIFDLSEKMCTHKIWFDKCNRSTKNVQCEVGMRNSIHYILSGSILTVWDIVETVITNSTKLNIVRLTTKTGERCVGVSIPHGSIDALIKRLQEREQIRRNEASQAAAAKEAELGESGLNPYDDSTDDDISFLN